MVPQEVNRAEEATNSAPKREAAHITREEVRGMICNDQMSPGKDFVLVDLRRNDFEGGTISGSLNLPAQSLLSTLPTWYRLLKNAGVQKVIWFCGSSRGRGPRAAGWFADYLAAEGDCDMQSLVLQGGIRGWASAGSCYTDLMDDYDETAWQEPVV